MRSCFWRLVLKRLFPVDYLVPNPQTLWIKYYLNWKVLGQPWILSMLLFILEWRHSSISFSHKNGFCKFTWKTIALMRFHFLVLVLNQKSVFSRFDDVKSPYLLLRDFTLLSILIEYVVLVVPPKKTIVYERFHHFALGSKRENEFLRFSDITMMSQVPRPKLRLGTGSFLLSDT